MIYEIKDAKNMIITTTTNEENAKFICIGIAAAITFKMQELSPNYANLNLPIKYELKDNEV